MSNEKEIKILVVDDEVSIVEFLKMGLSAEGYTVYTAFDGNQAIVIAKEIKPQLIILDLMLPGMNGYEVCTHIKSAIRTSIIMLTAKDEVEDCVRGLTLGADDYMVKPFSFKELLARIQVRVRNSFPEKLTLHELGVFKIDDGAHEIYYDNQLMEFSPTEYNLMKYLLVNNGIVLSKRRILENVWGYDFFGDENIVEVYIRYLRQKIGSEGHKRILTIRGAGYKVLIHEKN